MSHNALTAIKRPWLAYVTYLQVDDATSCYRCPCDKPNGPVPASPQLPPSGRRSWAARKAAITGLGIQNLRVITTRPSRPWLSAHQIHLGSS